MQDKLIYNVGAGFKGTCHPFQAVEDSLFDFSVGCLYMERWDDLNNFFNNVFLLFFFFFFFVSNTETSCRLVTQ